MNIRPVRLVPFAAGASPTSSTSASGSPNEGPGRPQYGWSANEARRPSRATSSRQRTRRGQARHTEIRAWSWGMPSAVAASRRTRAGVVATGVSASAGSPGHPRPAGTGREQISGDGVRVLPVHGAHARGGCPHGTGDGHRWRRRGADVCPRPRPGRAHRALCARRPGGRHHLRRRRRPVVPLPRRTARAGVEWGRATFERFAVLARDPDAGVALREGVLVERGVADRWWTQALPGWREARGDELPHGASGGVVASVPLVAMPVFLPWLDPVRRGGRRARRRPRDRPGRGEGRPRGAGRGVGLGPDDGRRHRGRRHAVRSRCWPTPGWAGGSSTTTTPTA